MRGAKYQTGVAPIRGRGGARLRGRGRCRGPEAELLEFPAGIGVFAEVPLSKPVGAAGDLVVDDEGAPTLATPPESGVPVVLDSIVGSAAEHAGNRGPFVAVLGVGSHYSGILFRSEGAVLDLGAQLVAPSEPAGLARSAGDRFADQGPVAWPVFLNKMLQRCVLLGAPRPLDPIGLIVARRFSFHRCH